MLVGVAALVGLTSGCTADSEPSRRAQPQLSIVVCPADVDVMVVPPHRCGYVTTDLRTHHRVFVVIVEPPTPSDLSPILETGTDVGMTPGYGGLAPIAQRTGRRTVIADLPGTGHSRPTLDCPEVRDLGDLAAERHPTMLVAAVTACRDRLGASGVDAGQFTSVDLAGELAAVMTALDEPRWVVMGHGTTAEVGRQLALAQPERVEALVLDSPVMSHHAALIESDRIVRDVAQQCLRDDWCRVTYGDPRRAWNRARADLGRSPLRVEVDGGAVPMDDAALARAVRWLVAPANLGAGRLPALLAEAAGRRPGPYLREFAATMATAPPLCVGYLPKCASDGPPAMGAVLSALCPELATEEPWAGACQAWGVTSASGAPRALTDVPTLALWGALDPYISPRAVRERLAALVPDAFLVEHDTAAHNVLSSAWCRELRNAWLAGDVSRPPPISAVRTDTIDFTF